MSYSLNESFFETIDTEEKAYWLGFLYADGYVSSARPWTVICHICDKEHLYSFKNSINFTGPIKTKKLSSYSRDNKESFRLEICRKKMCLDLHKLGCQSKNKYIFNTKYESAYWRGIFDGDGCISVTSRYRYFNNKKYGPYTVAKSYIILQKQDVHHFENILKKLNIQYQIEQSKTDYMYYVQFSSIPSIIKFGNWLYSDNASFLKRKKEKFIQLQSLL